MPKGKNKIVIGEFQGVTVYAEHLPAKRGGPDRVWFGLRQKNGKNNRWEVRENLSYVHGVDIQFRSK